MANQTRITLKKVRIAKNLSEETLAYTADGPVSTPLRAVIACLVEAGHEDHGIKQMIHGSGLAAFFGGAE